MAAPAVIPQTLFTGFATAAGATILASLVTTAYRITAITITNVDTSSHTISVYSSIGPMNMTDDQALYKDEPVDSGDTLVLDDPRVIGDYFNAGIGRLAVQSDADSVLRVNVYGALVDGDHADVGRSAPVQSFQGFLKTNAALSSLFAVATANISGVMMSLTLCNTSSANHSVDINQTFDGGANFFEVFIDFPVPANETVVLLVPIIIGVAAGTGLEALVAGADVDDVITATACFVYVDVG